MVAFLFLQVGVDDDGAAPAPILLSGGAGASASASAQQTPGPLFGIERSLLLHGISLGARRTARLSLSGVAEREFAQGDLLTDGVRLVRVEERRVALDVGGREIILTLEPSGAPGNRDGLDPEPVNPMPELPAGEIARRQGAARAVVEPTAEESALGIRP
ncbi:MAG: hypothetical protein QM680_05395 [Luteolibacter sp.]